MGKRSNFERNPRDYYPTPFSAVVPLAPHLNRGCKFWEPCVGNGALVEHLLVFGMVCPVASDVYPMVNWAEQYNALEKKVDNVDYIITNPPWDRRFLHPMIEHFRVQAPTWLLFDADWMHTRQSTSYMQYCQKIVSVGRVSWMENGTAGKDNCCWYLFGAERGQTVFYGRDAGA